MKVTPQGPSDRKLLDKFVPDEKRFGQLLGMLATTYEFQSEFYETDFLPTIFGLGGWDDRRWASRIEMEKNLHLMETATVFLDGGKYGTRPRSPRLSLIPSRGGRNNRLHAKLILCLYDRAVRLSVGSANLTEPGYRKNREAVIVVNVTEKAPECAHLVAEAIRPMPGLLRHWWNQETDSFADMILGRLKEWGSGKETDARWFVWGGLDKPLWRTFISRWPTGEPITRISIVSPFWSEEDGVGPLKTMLSELHSKGLVKDGTEVKLMTEAVRDAGGAAHPVLHPSYGRFQPAFGVKVFVQTVDPAILPEEVGNVKGFEGIRNLHAKVVLFEGERTSLSYVGSSNFTRKGWGFLHDPQDANIEAGIVILGTGKERGALSAMIPTAVGKAIELPSLVTSWGSTVQGDQPDPPWPLFLKEVVLSPSTSDPDSLDLVVSTNLDWCKGWWKVRSVAKDDGIEDSILDIAADEAPKGVYRRPIGKEMIEWLLKSQEVLVSWDQAPHGRPFPVNVDQAARQELPLCPHKPYHGEDQLIAYYQGRIAWSDLFPPPPGDEEQGGEEDTPSDIEEVVDTSRIQSYQVREFVEAIPGLVNDLRAASTSEASMRFALRGPISPLSLARRITEAAISERKTAMAAGFELVEIIAVLYEAKDYPVPERHRETWNGMLEDTIVDVRKLIDRVVKKLPGEFGPRSAFRKYVNAVLPKKAVLESAG